MHTSSHGVVPGLRHPCSMRRPALGEMMNRHRNVCNWKARDGHPRPPGPRFEGSGLISNSWAPLEAIVLLGRTTLLGQNNVAKSAAKQSSAMDNGNVMSTVLAEEKVAWWSLRQGTQDQHPISTPRVVKIPRAGSNDSRGSE